jgi:hypothetical protein
MAVEQDKAGSSRGPTSDASWLEDASPHDLRERLLRLAPTARGRIGVRYTTGDGVLSPIVYLTTRLHGTSIEVVAGTDGIPDLAPDWTRRWTFPEYLLDAHAVFEALETTLAGSSPPGSGGRMSIRLEMRPPRPTIRDQVVMSIVAIVVTAVAGGITYLLTGGDLGPVIVVSVIVGALMLYGAVTGEVIND